MEQQRKHTASPHPSDVSGPEPRPEPQDDSALRALQWRPIGPFRGGRVVAVAGDPADRQVYYFGSTGGGVWKTTDGGTYWRNVSDGAFRRASVGALAVAPSDPTVLYAGMGEATIRGNVSHGDGLYKSTDAGASWRHVGLADTRQVAKVRVHPADPDTAYVAALGHAHGANAERGVYRTRDGGASWERVLHRGEEVGACDLALDATNPRVLYAAFWRAVRRPHALEAGGEGCGLWRTADGGDTWEELTGRRGLPKGPLGKIGVAASPARAGRVWAIVEAAEGGVFRSDDGGRTWERLCEDREMRSRPWYYQHLIADPQDPETVWALNVRAYRSIDGGKSFGRVAIPHGDNHDLWIDPRDPRRMIAGHDGGACVSLDGAESWSTLYNQPTAEMYHVVTDNRVPYRVYGAQQDNSTISVPSRSRNAAITIADYDEVGGGESGYIAVRPDDPDIVYAGSYQGYLTRYDARTGQRRDISVWPEGTMGWPARELKHRFQWTFPIVLSPHHSGVLYACSQFVNRSTDEGASWEAISPDLTRHDPARLGDSGGPVTVDNVGTEYYGTVFAFAESPVARGVLWAGSDDGLVHVSRDGGASWRDVTPPDLPEWALVSLIEPSPHDAAAAYLAANRYKVDDFAPYLYKTDDYGKHWTKITAGLEPDVFARAIRADPERRGLLYAGTETGVQVSFDDGVRWQPLRLNLPVVPVHDLAVKGTDLVAATHGRGFWILDDLGPLRQLAPDARSADFHLFAPRPTIRFWTDQGLPQQPSAGKIFADVGYLIAAARAVEAPDGQTVRQYLDAGQNPRDGVYVSYLLRERPRGSITLTFLDAAGQEIRTYSSAEPPSEVSAAPLPLAPAEQTPEERARGAERKEPPVPAEPGLNRFYWDMRHAEARRIEGYVASDDNLAGPLVAPGRYQVRLCVGDRSATVPFEIQKDPRVPVSQEELDAQVAMLLRLRDKISEVHDAVNTIRNVRRQVEEWERRARDHDDQAEREAIAGAAKALKERLAAVEEELTQVKATNRQDTLSLPIKLNAKLAKLVGVVASADAAPTRQACATFEDLAARVDAQLERLRAIVAGELDAFNRRVRESDLAAVIPSAALAAGR